MSTSSKNDLHQIKLYNEKINKIITLRRCRGRLGTGMGGPGCLWFRESTSEERLSATAVPDNYVGMKNFAKVVKNFPVIARSQSYSTRNGSIGDSFEIFTVKSLKKHGMEINLCGGPGDRGVDFRGNWNLQSRSVKTIGQCRFSKRKLGPVHLRELEGTLSHEQGNTLGMIVTNIG